VHDSGSGGDDSLPDMFWAVARRMRRGSSETLAPFDLSPSHIRALRAMLRHDDLRLSQLAQHLQIAARSTTEVVDALEQRGLAQRSPDPDDRRATLVSATDEGRATMSAVRRARMAEADELFDRLSPADRRELARILQTLLD
jgi:DNA-binding MarR family transcriptional regulator